MSEQTLQAPNAGPMRPLLLIGALIAVQLAGIVLFYDHLMYFECYLVAPSALCQTFSSMVPRTICALAVVAFFVIARPDIRKWFLRNTNSSLNSRLLAAQVIGYLLILTPWLWLRDGGSFQDVLRSVPFWSVGLIATVFSTFSLVARPSVWFEALKRAGLALWIALGVALLIPEIARVFTEAVWWHIDLVTQITFQATASLLQFSDLPVYIEESKKHLGLGEFIVEVADQCSGVEGFLLITAFLGFYMWLFRDQLRFPMAFILFPLGIILSWCFNVVRIAVLIVLGARVSPELAVNGFHSHAGWVMFTLLASGAAIAAHKVPFFRKPTEQLAVPTGEAPREIPPLHKDPIASQILPFVVFMLSALLSQTFSETPAIFYPFRALAMVAVLAMFWGVYRQMDWRVSPLAIAAGAVIGILWVATAPAAQAGDTAFAAILAGMSGAMFAIWVFTRVIGTFLLVPMIEELFFRGYLLDRISGDMSGKISAKNVGQLRVVLAIVITSVLFAALHDRWIAGGLAAVAFALLRLRSGRLSDAIAAHAVANGLIAASAIWAQNWSLI